jgi:hypothetical protein
MEDINGNWMDQNHKRRLILDVELGKGEYRQGWLAHKS